MVGRPRISAVRQPLAIGRSAAAVPRTPPWASFITLVLAFGCSTETPDAMSSDQALPVKQKRSTDISGQGGQ